MGLQGDCLFSVQGPDPSWGWGRARSPPGESSGSARPPEGLGRGQGSRQAPDLAGSGGQRALLRCRGGAKCQARATGRGWGWARPAQDPRWEWGLSGGSGGQGVPRAFSYLAGWGLLISSPFGGMVDGGA